MCLEIIRRHLVLSLSCRGYLPLLLGELAPLSDDPLFLDLSWLFKQNKLVDCGVVVVIELHDSPHEGIVLVLGLEHATELVFLQGHHHGLLDEVSGVDVAIYVHLLLDFDLVDSLSVDVHVLHRLVVGVLVADIDRVAHVLAGRALHVLEVADLGVGVGQLVLLLGLVLGELAAGVVLLPLAATPPHLAAPLGLMNAAAPVVVLLVVELLVAVLAVPNAIVNFPFFLHFFKHLLQLVVEVFESLDLLFLFVQVVDMLLVFFKRLLQTVLQLLSFFLEHVLDAGMRLLQHRFGLGNVFGLFAELVPLRLHFACVLLSLLVFRFQGLEEALQHHLRKLQSFAVLFVD